MRQFFSIMQQQLTQSSLDPSGKRHFFSSSSLSKNIRHGDLMVSALHPGASAWDLSPDWGHCVVFLGKTLTLTVPLSNQVYKWVPAKLLLGDNPAMDQHPIQGGVEIFLVASCYGNWDRLRSDEPLDSYVDFTLSRNIKCL